MLFPTIIFVIHPPYFLPIIFVDFMSVLFSIIFLSFSSLNFHPNIFVAFISLFFFHYFLSFLFPYFSGLFLLSSFPNFFPIAFCCPCSYFIFHYFCHPHPHFFFSIILVILIFSPFSIFCYPSRPFPIFLSPLSPYKHLWSSCHASPASLPSDSSPALHTCILQPPHISLPQHNTSLHLTCLCLTPRHTPPYPSFSIPTSTHARTLPHSHERCQNVGEKNIKTSLVKRNSCHALPTFRLCHCNTFFILSCSENTYCCKF